MLRREQPDKYHHQGTQRDDDHRNAAVLGVAIDPAAALLGVPLLPGAMWGTKMAQVKTAVHAQTHLESILDCLERGEPLVLERD